MGVAQFGMFEAINLSFVVLWKTSRKRYWQNLELLDNLLLQFLFSSNVRLLYFRFIKTLWDILPPTFSVHAPWPTLALESNRVGALVLSKTIPSILSHLLRLFLHQDC